jgi:hypothetical protein
MCVFLGRGHKGTGFRGVVALAVTAAFARSDGVTWCDWSLVCLGIIVEPRWGSCLMLDVDPGCAAFAATLGFVV